MERGTVRANCLSQEHNTMLPARAYNKAACSVVQCTKRRQNTRPSTKPSTCRATLFRCKFSSVCPVFFTLHDQLIAQQKHNCGLKKFVVKSRGRVYFEQQILALLLIFHQVHNLSCNKFACAIASQPISALHFFNPQQMFLLWVKVSTQGEKRENLQRNNVARQVEGFCILYFAALRHRNFV